jgi:hypothetical protein
MLDWWRDDEHRLSLAKSVRAAIGDKYLIITNTNDRTAAKSALYINGYFMECTRSKTAAEWKRIAATLKWAERNLRPPHVNCIETWFHNSREDLHLMRATTTLALTHSDGYCLFSDPNPLPTGDHRHNWYPFWDKSLGKPNSEGTIRDDGTIVREFENGTVVYNPMGNSPVEITFRETRKSVATGISSEQHNGELGGGSGICYGDTPGPGCFGGLHAVGGVLDNDAMCRLNSHSFGGNQEKLGIGLFILNVITIYINHLPVWNSDGVQDGTGFFKRAGRRNRDVKIFSLHRFIHQFQYAGEGGQRFFAKNLEEIVLPELSCFFDLFVGQLQAVNSGGGFDVFFRSSAQARLKILTHNALDVKQIGENLYRRSGVDCLGIGYHAVDIEY